MTDTEEDVLTNRIRELEKELESLRLQQNARRDESDQKKASSLRVPLELEEYVRYGRQMIIPQIGLSGQLALKKSSVLVIGAGGLGCPVLLYLVAAGIGIQCLYFASSNLQERWV
jgi:adenylyltransferase and sulfurtransferase